MWQFILGFIRGYRKSWIVSIFGGEVSKKIDTIE